MGWKRTWIVLNTLEGTRLGKKIYFPILYQISKDEESFKARKRAGHRSHVKYTRLTQPLQVQIYEDFFRDPKYYSIEKLSQLYGLKRETVKGYIILMNEKRKMMASPDYVPPTEDDLAYFEKMDKVTRNDMNIVDATKHQVKVFEKKPEYICVDDKDLKTVS